MTTFTHSEKKYNLFSDYCQYLYSSFTNFTQTYFAKHTNRWNHDQLNRFLRNENIPTSELWTSVKDHINFDEEGYLIFDDVVLSKIHSNLFMSNKGRTEYSDKRFDTIKCEFDAPKVSSPLED